ncbi:hypothetical protein GCM10010207_46450 [Streptomyces atratus]|nr:hypothetical protein GCM10010207_46450 [Streptomyces atratus]
MLPSGAGMPTYWPPGGRPEAPGARWPVVLLARSGRDQEAHPRATRDLPYDRARFALGEGVEVVQLRMVVSGRAEMVPGAYEGMVAQLRLR